MMALKMNTYLLVVIEAGCDASVLAGVVLAGDAEKHDHSQMVMKMKRRIEMSSV